ncbi:hypothetical protein B0H12DRAFT_1093466 [Mycena haematopus]|nr:hypothetical protein B0H12DRAFT_1093466 [Mycena haematopus]
MMLAEEETREVCLGTAGITIVVWLRKFARNRALRCTSTASDQWHGRSPPDDVKTGAGVDFGEDNKPIRVSGEPQHRWKKPRCSRGGQENLADMRRAQSSIGGLSAITR